MLKIHAGWLMLLVVTLAPAALHAASFDCMKAVSRTDKMICANEELSLADEKLAHAYRAAYRKTRDKKALNAAQRSWARKRNSATDPEELKFMYKTRIDELKKSAADSNQPSWKEDGRSPRKAYLSTDGELEINDLGYGKAAFRLLVINHQGHIGELQGIMTVANGTAKYVAEECELDFTFGSDRITVKQNFDKGTCGAGTNVALEGVYKRSGRRGPKR